MGDNLSLKEQYLLSLGLIINHKYGDISQDKIVSFSEEYNFKISNESIFIIDKLVKSNSIIISNEEEKLINLFLKLLDNVYSVFEEVDDIFIEGAKSSNNIDKNFKLAFYIDCGHSFQHEIKYLKCLKYIFRNNNQFCFKDEYNDIIDKINLINEDYYQEDCIGLFTDRRIISIFDSINIKKIINLIEVNNDIKYLIFNCDFQKNIIKINNLEEKKNNIVWILKYNLTVIKYNRFRVNFGHKEDIFYYTYGINCDKKTFDEIAELFNSTYAKIRRIELNTEKKLNEIYSEKFNEFILKVWSKLNIQEDYINFYDVQRKLNDNELCQLLIAYLKIFDSPFQYDKEYNIFYKKDKLEEIIKEKEMVLPVVINFNELSSYDLLEQAIINNKKFYHKTRLNAYIKSDLSLIDLYCLVIDEEYPDGFKINDEFMNRINYIMKEKYDIDSITDRALEARILRCGYCYIDRGMLQNRKFVFPLTDDLKNRILDFMDKYDGDVIYYKTIYSEFENDLKKIGINNRYYLKGVLDINLPQSYIIKRDYISIGENFKSALDEINETIDSLNGFIDFDILRGKFPGVEDYTFYNQLSKRKDIIFSDYGKKFYKLDYEIINDGFNKIIIDEIKNLFKLANSDTITSSKLYSRLMIFHSDIMKEVPFIDNQFILFSYVSKNINEFYYERPYISSDKNIKLNREAIIENNLKKFDYFNNKTIQAYCQRIHLRGIKSYLDFMINESNDFVQINVDTCIKKEKIKINEYSLEIIKNEIDYYINSFGPINTGKPFSYDGFPNIGYSWNKYLLVGVVRTFLNENYFIEYTDNLYTKTDFIIRRSINVG